MLLSGNFCAPSCGEVCLLFFFLFPTGVHFCPSVSVSVTPNGGEVFRPFTYGTVEWRMPKRFRARDHALRCKLSFLPSPSRDTSLLLIDRSTCQLRLLKQFLPAALAVLHTTLSKSFLSEQDARNPLPHDRPMRQPNRCQGESLPGLNF